MHYYYININMNQNMTQSMTLGDFFDLCHQILRELNVENPNFHHFQMMFRVAISNTNQVFVCDRYCWWIETYTSWGASSESKSRTDYTTIEELKNAFRSYFGSATQQSKFGTSEAQLWIAIDKLTDVVHSRL
jgi:hypothetical protein